MLLTWWNSLPAAMSPSAIITEQSPVQHTLDPDSKITLGNLSPGRLSPNLFLGINLDPNSMDRNLSFEWTSYASPSTSSTANNHQPQFQHRSINSDPNCLNMEDTTPYDDIKFLNGEQFNMEAYKGDCILNIDPNMLTDDQQKQHNIIGLDLHNFTFDDDDGIDKSSPLLDLERPLINITVQNMGDKY